MEIVLIIASVISLLSLPLMYLVEAKIGMSKLMRRIHLGMLAAGVLWMIAIPILLEWQVSSAAEGIRGWAEDFFYSYFTPSVVSTVIIVGLLSGAAAVRHSMRRIRMILAGILPFVMTATALFSVSIAEGGYFAVDLYIGALIPGFGFLVHAVPICERVKKKNKKK
ncbi:MAG: hypothetical protein E7578_09425 [Ruminococcaceae bacterium]|nr:hypothetical protein [Oscillospiraceae bacterium]